MGTIRGPIVLYCGMGYRNPEDKKKWRRRYAKANPEKIRRWAVALRKRRKRENPPRVLHRQVREKVFERYGAVCVSCGYKDKRALDLDHINGRGGEPRKRGMTVAYEALYAPDGVFRILCRNCNWIAYLERKE